VDIETADMPKPLNDLLHYWQSKQLGGKLPSRADLSPVEMKGFLPHTVLLDVVRNPVDDLRFRVRLTGTHIVDAFRYEFTGKFLDELAFGGRETELIGACSKVVHEKKPSVLSGEMNWPAGGQVLSIDSLWVPLSTDGAAVNIILAGTVISDKRRRG